MEEQVEMGNSSRYIAELNAGGDTKYTWDSKNSIECEAAQGHFDKLKGKGFMIFRVKMFGRRGGEVERFDPKEGKYIYKAPTFVEAAEKFDSDACYVATPMVTGG